MGLSPPGSPSPTLWSVSHHPDAPRCGSVRHHRHAGRHWGPLVPGSRSQAKPRAATLPFSEKRKEGTTARPGSVCPLGFPAAPTQRAGAGRGRGCRGSCFPGSGSGERPGAATAQARAGTLEPASSARLGEPGWLRLTGRGTSSGQPRRRRLLPEGRAAVLGPSPGAGAAPWCRSCSWADPCSWSCSQVLRLLPGAGAGPVTPPGDARPHGWVSGAVLRGVQGGEGTSMPRGREARHIGGSGGDTVFPTSPSTLGTDVTLLEPPAPFPAGLVPAPSPPATRDPVSVSPVSVSPVSVSPVSVSPGQVETSTSGGVPANPNPQIHL